MCNLCLFQTLLVQLMWFIIVLEIECWITLAHYRTRFIFAFCKYITLYQYLLLYTVYSNLTEVFINLTEVSLTLTVVFPCFFLSCKANARVRTRKDGARPALFHIIFIWVVRLLFVLFCLLLCVNVYCYRVTTQLQLINILLLLLLLLQYVSSGPNVNGAR
jgi:hypothetical protein